MDYFLDVLSPAVALPIIVLGILAITVQSILVYVDAAALPFEKKYSKILADILLLASIFVSLTALSSAWYLSNLKGFKFNGNFVYIASATWLLAGFLMLYATAILKYIKYILVDRKRITGISVKEAMDTLPMGLAFSKEDGTVLFANKKIYEIGFELIGLDLQDLRLFWELVKAESMLPGFTKEIVAKDLILVRSAEKAYQFRLYRKNIDGESFVEVMVLDVTEKSRIIEDIKIANIKLEEARKKLREMAFNEERIRLEKEHLRLKSFFHDELGKDATMIYRYLDKKYEIKDAIVLLQLISKDLNNMKMRKIENAKDSLITLKRLTESVGVNLIINGELDFELAVCQYMVEIIIEAVTNGIRHGKADNLFVNISKRNENFFMTIENDGIITSLVNEKNLREGGGLSGIRNKVEELGGSISIDTSNRFKIELLIPIS